MRTIKSYRTGSNTQNTANSYRYELDRTSKKWSCPECGQRRFVRCVDNETKNYLPDHIGRCDRENGCGYEFTWSQWLKQSGEKYKPVKKPDNPIKSIDYLLFDQLKQSVNPKYRTLNNLYLFLCDIFTEKIASQLFNKYFIGTTKAGATVYWQIDEQERIHQCKSILYNRHTGKRDKEYGAAFHGRFITNLKNPNFEQCFFGQHLLAEYPNDPVCIVESEKTAIIASVYLPGFVWLSTGGASGCKWREYAVYKVVKNRNVTFFPDYGIFNKKSGLTCFDEWKDRCNRIRESLSGTQIKVSDILERRLKDKKREDQDLADMLLIRDKSTGIALTEAGYPVIWDL